MRPVRRSVLFPLLLLAAFPGAARAHAGRPLAPHDLWTAWSGEPLVLLGIGLGALAYRRGLRALWGRAGVGRGIRSWQAWAYTGGLLALAVALVSPLDALGGALFSGHMVQHLVLVLGAAPLLALGAPLLGWLWALPPGGRRAVARGWHRAPALRALARALSHPASAWLLHAGVLWAWHVPGLYDAAVASDVVHAAEHASFLFTAFLFWWALVHPGGAFRRAPGLGVLYVFTFALQNGILGAWLTLATRSLYAAHAHTTQVWGFTPLQDQQIAGAIMWVPGSTAYLLAVVALFARWLKEAERRVRQHERGAPGLPPGARTR
jgi:putative membrane protein